MDEQNYNLLQTIITMRNICLDKQHNKRNKTSAFQNTTTSSNLKTSMEEISQENRNLFNLPVLTHQSFELLLKQQRERFGEEQNKEETNKKRENYVPDVLEVFIDNDVITLMKEKLLSVRS